MHALQQEKQWYGISVYVYFLRITIVLNPQPENKFYFKLFKLYMSPRETIILIDLNGI